MLACLACFSTCRLDTLVNSGEILDLKRSILDAQHIVLEISALVYCSKLCVMTHKWILTQFLVDHSIAKARTL